MLSLLMALSGCAHDADEDSAIPEEEAARMDPWLAAAAARLEGSGDPLPAMFVDVDARVNGPGESATWTAQAEWGGAAPGRALEAGECRRAPVRSSAEPGADRLELLGGRGAPLRWSPDRGTWELEGPRRWLDPAWSVSDLRWVDERGAHMAEDAVRFGGVPEPTRLVRAREGTVSLAWDPATAATVSVLAIGPAGALVCGTGAGQVTLPWWSVPAEGGAILLQSTREYTTLVDGTLLRVRTTLERVVPLDRPAGTMVEEKPAVTPPRPLAPVPAGPRRLNRSARQTIG